MAIVLSNQWLQKRRPYWERLANLLHQAESSGLKGLSRAELQETALLYRQVASDLSTLRQDPTAYSYSEHINQLLARAHHIIYSTRKTNILAIFRFFRDDYPALIQREMRLVLVSLAITVSGAALGSVLTLARPEFTRTMLGPEMMGTIECVHISCRSIVGLAPAASSAIM